jgi:hypothetical protein
VRSIEVSGSKLIRSRLLPCRCPCCRLRCNDPWKSSGAGVKAGRRCRISSVGPCRPRICRERGGNQQHPPWWRCRYATPVA